MQTVTAYFNPPWNQRELSDLRLDKNNMLKECLLNQEKFQLEYERDSFFKLVTSLLNFNEDDLITRLKQQIIKSSSFIERLYKVHYEEDEISSLRPSIDLETFKELLINSNVYERLRNFHSSSAEKIELNILINKLRAHCLAEIADIQLILHEIDFTASEMEVSEPLVITFGKGGQKIDLVHGIFYKMVSKEGFYIQPRVLLQ